MKIMKIKWMYENPKKAGNYLVETETPEGRINTMRINWTGKSWSFSGQVFYRYLLEEVVATEKELSKLNLSKRVGIPVDKSKATYIDNRAKCSPFKKGNPLNPGMFNK